MLKSVKYTAAHNIDLPRPIATEILDLEKPRFSIFRQNGGQNYIRFRFSVQIRILHRRLGRSSPKSQKFLRDTFLRNLGSKVQKFKNYLNVLQKLFTCDFLIFCGSHAPLLLCQIWFECVEIFRVKRPVACCGT